MTLHTKIARHATRRAFTLMEMLIVVAIIVALAGIGAFYVLPQLKTSKEKLAKAGAINVEKALTAYYTDHQHYPTDINLLSQKDELGGPYIEAEGLNDPWGQRYDVDIADSNRHGGAKPHVFTKNPENQKMISN
jgi:general secretion pathway protein G